MHQGGAGPAAMLGSGSWEQGTGGGRTAGQAAPHPHGMQPHGTPARTPEQVWWWYPGPPTAQTTRQHHSNGAGPQGKRAGSGGHSDRNRHSCRVAQAMIKCKGLSLNEASEQKGAGREQGGGPSSQHHKTAVSTQPRVTQLHTRELALSISSWDQGLDGITGIEKHSVQQIYYNTC